MRKTGAIPILLTLAVMLHMSGWCRAISPVAPRTPVSALQSLSYLYAGTTNSYIRNVDRTGGNLTSVCPDYFEITPGTARLKVTKKFDAAFIAAMNKRGVLVTPFLSNHWDRALAREMLNNREAFSTELALFVTDNALDGVDIDIENITHDDRAAFTDFIVMMREKLPPGKKLTVCVPANPWGGNTGWQGAYDYARLAEYADHLFVMAYDEHYSGGSPGAVSSIDFVEKSIKYAVSKAPAEKIMLGIPFYGRYWVDGAASGGQAFTNADVAGIVAAYPSTVWYDEAAQCARAQVTVSAELAGQVLWGSKALSAGVYNIWYENDRSLEKKLSLVRKYGLLGAGSWALGQEPASMWDSYRLWLCGLPFGDIEHHWAQEYIVDMYGRGVVWGMTGSAFAPESVVRRAEAVAMMMRLLGLSDREADNPFADMNGHWAQGLVGAAKKIGLVEGDGGLFRPDEPMSRAEFAVLADRCVLLPDTLDLSDNMFDDVSAELMPWANNATVKLAVAGVINGVAPGLFGPSLGIKRGEAAKMLALIAGYPQRAVPNVLQGLKKPGEVTPIEPR